MKTTSPPSLTVELSAAKENVAVAVVAAAGVVELSVTETELVSPATVIVIVSAPSVVASLLRPTLTVAVPFESTSAKPVKLPLDRSEELTPEIT